MAEQPSNRKKIILIGLGVAATGLLGYFGWQYYRKLRKNREADSDPPAEASPPPHKSAFAPGFFLSKDNRNDDLPLKKGSRGQRVKALQNALVARYGREILPRYGADGDFGSEMEAALKKLRLPEVIDENTFNVLVQAPAVNAPGLAKQLYRDAASKNFTGVMVSLKKMSSREDYTAVSDGFKKLFLRGVRQTLVNGLLGSFTDERQKQQIRLEFTRMGLKYDGSKWSLSGIDGFTIITKEPAIVWRTSREGAKVPAGMVLGTEVAIRNDYTLFENDGKKFLVKTSSIQYL